MTTKLTKTFLLLIFIYLGLNSSILVAQNVGIGTTTPNPSAKLDITDTQRGVLIPRINIPNLNAAAPVIAPATSLLVYNTNPTTKGFYYWDGIKWTRLLDQADDDWDINVNTTGLEAAAATDNSASGDYSIAAGLTDTASGYVAVVSGGEANKATGDYTFVGGGYGNASTGILATVGGGGYNQATQYAVIGGGWTNTASGSSSTIAGGQYNIATQIDATVSGGERNLASGSASVVAGGLRNAATNQWAIVSGGRLDTASGQYSIIVGGSNNKAKASYSIIGGGNNNVVNGQYGLVSGGANNIVNGQYGLVSGGANNTSHSYGEWVGGLFATNYTPNSASAWNSDDRIFTLGNGTGTSARSNALTIYKNGFTDINGEVKIRTINDTTAVGNLLTANPDGIIRKISYSNLSNSVKDHDWYKVGTTNSADNINDDLFTQGRVGIGTIAPTETLHINGNTRIGIISPANTGTLPSEGNRLFFSGGAGSAIYNSENSDAVYLARYNSASDHTQLRVFLGDNPQAEDALVVGHSVAGAFTEKIRLQTDGNAQKPGGGTWATLSDKRTKKDIIPFKDGLSVLNKINPVTFKYNGLYNSVNDGQDYVGIIAQDVKEVAPYMIGSQDASKTAESTTKEEILNYDGGTYMIYVLVNAVKEQQETILKQEKDIASILAANQKLVDKLETIQTENEAIKTQVSSLVAMQAELAEIKALLNTKAQK